MSFALLWRRQALLLVHTHTPDIFLNFLPATFSACADPEDPMRLTNETRTLGLIVCRGTSVMLVAPSDGTEEIENPFLAAE